MVNALDLIDAAIADLEARLNLAPGGSIEESKPKEVKAEEVRPKQGKKKNKPTSKGEKKGGPGGKQNKAPKNKAANLDQPDICKLEFKVGQISKVWVHSDADKLYCEEIECGEEKPRQIASGLRPHYSLEEMQGRRLLVVSNLKVRL
jgi:tRNA-binding EMAP/Myf-like protein